MKRTFISLGIILLLLTIVVVGDMLFVTSMVSGFNEYLDAMDEAERLDEKIKIASSLDEFYQKRNFWAHRLIPTNHIEEIEMLLHKLNAYLAEEDMNEIKATIAEIRARVNLLYSTTIYHWYHPNDFSIE